MKLIERTDYLDKLKNTIHTPDIKVITGIRRSGKSKLLEMFIGYLNKTIPDANIIHINYNLFQFSSIKHAEALNEYVEKQFAQTKENFLLIDEVQLCKDFEQAINSFHASEKYHIYITGSNAFLLSNDLATLFTGRTYSVEVFPFSFKEFLSYFADSDIQQAFDRFEMEGGMSGSYLYGSIEDKYNYLNEVFETLIVRDIQQKYRIRNDSLLDSLNDFLVDNISSEVSARSIANTLTSKGSKTDDKTVSSYIKYLCASYAYYKIRRYDIKGKRYLASQDKYYLADHSFKYSKHGTKNYDYGKVYENIVCIELLRRGYEVYTGVLYQKEIDFVAIKRNEKLYIQVSDNISSKETMERESSPLLSIKDAYPKLIIARTRHPKFQYEGIAIWDIALWLVNG
ncbi:MAG: ATP-binding protein [Sphaerochaetaceae bacterium]|nr:ATP-binding protein [Sphaerochaetaceae bacterium]